MLFKKVETDEDLSLFNNIWMDNWAKMGFEMEPFTGFAERFIIHSQSGHPAATVELVPYNPIYGLLKETSTIEDLFCFSNIEKIKKHREKCYEIDKISILDKYKNKKTLDQILNFLYNFAEVNKLKFYLAVIEPVFFRTLKYYKVPVIKAGHIISHEGYKVIPAIIDIDFAFKNKKDFKWDHFSVTTKGL